jgi:hypothetical protein
MYKGINQGGQGSFVRMQPNHTGWSAGVGAILGGVGLPLLFLHE